MNPWLVLVICFLLIIGFANIALTEDDSVFIYGKVYARHNQSYEGRLIWNNHETCWEDILNSKHRIRSKYTVKKSTKRVFGFLVEERGKRSLTTSLAIKFGHLKAIERRTQNSAYLYVKDGRKIMVSGGGNDIGSNNRGIIVEDPNEGPIKLTWNELDKVEFKAEPDWYVNDVALDDVYRLCARVHSCTGEVFEGALMWDNDETLSSHILDGKENGEDHKIEFGEISVLERDGTNGTIVKLRNGEVIRLTSSNDVNSGNRGIFVHDPSYGQIQIPWRYFERLEFIDPTNYFLRKYNEFDGGIPLMGRVEDKNGEIVEGEICWDDDECYSSDILDGKYKYFTVRIEFANIRSIRRQSQQSAVVEFTDNKKLKLSGTNDVGVGNKGVVITTATKRDQHINWRDLEEVEFRYLSNETGRM